MTTTTGKPPGSTPQPRARPERRSRKRRATGTAPAEPAQGRARDGQPTGTATKATPAKAAPAKAPSKGTPKPAPAKAPSKSASTKSASAKGTAAKGTAAKSARTRGTGRASRRGAAHAPPRAPFVLLIVGLLGGALVSLLLLNTVLAKDAFTLTRLQQSNKLLEQQRQAYQADIAREGSPEALSKRAEAMRMRKQTELAFVDGRTGRTTGARIRPVPHSAAASAGAASMLGIPGTIVPGDPRAVGAPSGTGAP